MLVSPRSLNFSSNFAPNVLCNAPISGLLPCLKAGSTEQYYWEGTRLFLSTVIAEDWFESFFISCPYLFYIWQSFMFFKICFLNHGDWFFTYSSGIVSLPILLFLMNYLFFPYFLCALLSINDVLYLMSLNLLLKCMLLVSVQLNRILTSSFKMFFVFSIFIIFISSVKKKKNWNTLSKSIFTILL